MIELEIDEEEKFADRAFALGCKAIKFIIPGVRNAPDRQVLCPGGRVIFFEFKKTGKSARRGQKKFHAGLRSMGFECYVVYTADQAEGYLRKFLCL